MHIAQPIKEEQMNIKCLFNKHNYVPIQYVDESTDYEWTYTVHCSRCHKESICDMNVIHGVSGSLIKKWIQIPSSPGTEAYEQERPHDYNN